MSDRELSPVQAHILLVEDEPGLQEAYALIFELEGYRVSRASDGSEALLQLADSVPDLILTDYMMPRMNGLDMIVRIRRDPRLAAVPILLTSAALPHYVDKSSADEFLAKPVSVKTLLATVRRLLTKSARS